MSVKDNYNAEINTRDDAVNFIHSLAASKPGRRTLDRFRSLCAFIGDPQECFKTVHIAGTNGKGSATSMIAKILEEWGYRTGKYLSPYIYRFEERISINGTDISGDDLVKYTVYVRNAILECTSAEDFPVQFEFITLIAFCYYKDQKCDFAVLETGLGGKLDCTNVILAPEASVITTIDYDHMNILGNTLEEITNDKCGIIKKNSICIASAMNEEAVIKQISHRAAEMDSLCYIADCGIKKLRVSLYGVEFMYNGKHYAVSLAGEHQMYNAAAAVETIRRLNGKSLSYKSENDEYETISRGLKDIKFPARCEILNGNPVVVFDGTHNKSGVRALNNMLNEVFEGRKVNLYSGMLTDKLPDDVLNEYFKLNKKYVVNKFTALPVNSPRAMKAEDYCKIARKYFPQAEMLDSIGLLSGDIISNDEGQANIIFGSLYLAADVKEEMSKISGS